MLFWLLNFVHELLPTKFFDGLANLFGYVTFRVALATTTSFILCLAFAPKLIKTLKQLKIIQPINENAPETHAKKKDTPTMGGLLIICAIAISTLLWCKLGNGQIWVALIALIGFSAVGAFDDAQKIKQRRNKGLSKKQKIIALSIISLFLALLIMHFGLRGEETSKLAVPFFKNWRPEVGAWIYLVICLVLVATSNAVNVTDGVDGLATGGILVVSATFGILAYVAGHIGMANYLFVPFVSGASELTVFMGAMGGACLGFLWFNAHPAEIFMGDTGSLGLGGALGTVAVLIQQELLLIIAGGLFVWEALSVIMQVGSYQLRGGKRIFIIAPFHHHMEKSGIDEPKVAIRLWIIAIICSLLALGSLKLR